MRNLRCCAGVFALSLALALVGCGQAQDNATLTVNSVPQAEVIVDGVSHGVSGQALTLPAGAHKIELKADGFETLTADVTLAANETKPFDACLDAQDPSSPTVVARLMESEGLEVAPWVAPETTRGHSRKESVAVLLWPSNDVRQDGLVNFAVEADETYGGDATLEFRMGRTVLFREAFRPEEITTVRAIPAEVLESVKVNSTVQWGLYFDDSRHAITTSFTVVRRPNAEKQLERIRASRHMARQPEITRAIAEAVVLENNRLYTEALVANLKIANDHPNSTQPFRGIVTTLRRLDAENSELFATVSPFVSGKGGQGITARDGALGISAWSPVQQGALPTPTAAPTANGPRAMGPGGAGLTPTGGTGQGTESAPEATAEGGATAPATSEVARLRDEVEKLASHKKDLGSQIEQANQSAADAEENAAAAEAEAERAETIAREARDAVENAEEPTREQQEQMMQAGVAAEEARERARAARDAARNANELAESLRRASEVASNQLEGARKELDEARVREVQPDPTRDVAGPGEHRGEKRSKHEHPAGLDPVAAPLQEALSAAEASAAQAQVARDEARKLYDEAQTRYDENPDAGTQQALDEAKAAFDAAEVTATQAQQGVEDARRALDDLAARVAGPSRPSGPADGIK